MWHADTGGNRLETSPVDVDWIKRHLGQQDILDIDILAPGFWDSFSCGLDLCVGALYTDIAIAYSTLSYDAARSAVTSVTTTMSLFVFHLIAASIIVLILRHCNSDEFRTKEKSRTVKLILLQFTNVLGIGALIAAFVILRSPITW